MLDFMTRLSEIEQKELLVELMREVKLIRFWKFFADWSCKTDYSLKMLYLGSLKD